MTQDILSLLKSSQLPDPRQTSLPVISLWNTARHFIIFFTLKPELLKSHYDDTARSYHCLGSGCPACKVGCKATVHIYIPVWDVANRRIAVLKVAPQSAAADRLSEFLDTYQARLADIVAVFDCAGKGVITVVGHNALPETDRGALRCKSFAEDLEAGRVSLDACVKRLAADEIERLVSVRGRIAPAIGPVAGSTRLGLANSATPTLGDTAAAPTQI